MKTLTDHVTRIGRTGPVVRASESPASERSRAARVAGERSERER